mmetsp:Transcript_8009/g.19930  ORF Transcript_8009/g.19930 Transcript_8009/m.19930 type:complete len:102 (+) Transcript_8009:1016-1321(+)
MSLAVDATQLIQLRVCVIVKGIPPVCWMKPLILHQLQWIKNSFEMVLKPGQRLILFKWGTEVHSSLGSKQELNDIYIFPAQESIDGCQMFSQQPLKSVHII